jgi:N-formylglutamate amidohydrolase
MRVSLFEEHRPSGVAVSEVPGVLRRTEPHRLLAPVVLDSPHSGNLYPADFDFICALDGLRRAEDAHVEDLFGEAPQLGAALLAALFPRSYIDVNRAIDDIDGQLLAAPWPGPVRESERARVGMGLVRRVCRPGVPIYDRRLRVAEIRHRIDAYYRPYHAALSDMLSAAYRQFGAVWHLNCHSMPSTAASLASRLGWQRSDIVLGDRDGTTCAPEFLAVVREAFESLGYTVATNDPYKGVELVRRHGRPEQGLHSLQIEINRRLYMDEETLAPNRGYTVLKQHLTKVVATVCDFTRDQLFAVAAD